MSELIDDPIKLIGFANKHIAKLEMYIALEEKKDEPDIQNIARMEGHLVKWSEELEHAIHQAYQQGRTRKDITDASKVRVNA